MKHITDLFKKLVMIDSPSGQEENMTSYLLAWLKKQGFSTKQDKVGNVFATNNIPGNPLLLCGHMDTVEPGKGIKPVVKNGVIKSDGTTILGADNKAALTAIMIAVEKVKNSKPLEILFTVKEETGGGVEFFPFEWITAQKALVFDSANKLGGIILQSPYIINFKVTVTGKAAHASQPQEGINAFTPAIEALHFLKTGVLDGGVTTINIGLIKGGSGINTIPGSLTIQGEVRSYSKKLFNKHVTRIEKLFKKQAKKSMAAVSFTTDGYCPGYGHDKKDPLVTAVVACLNKTGLDPIYHSISGVSDANVLNEKGIKTVNLADGTIHPHTVNECISEQDLNTLSAIITNCIQNL